MYMDVDRFNASRPFPPSGATAGVPHGDRWLAGDVAWRAMIGYQCVSTLVAFVLLARGGATLPGERTRGVPPAPEARTGSELVCSGDGCVSIEYG